MIEMLHFYQIQFQLYPQYLLDPHHIALIADGIADLRLILDEVVLIADDEVEVVDEVVGKKSDLFKILILYFFRKCLY